MSAKLVQKEIDEAKAWLKEEAPVFATRITPVYRALNWNWACGYDFVEERIPSEERILETINSMIDELYVNGHSNISMSSGGLEVYVEILPEFRDIENPVESHDLHDDDIFSDTKTRTRFGLRFVAEIKNEGGYNDTAISGE